MVRVRADILVNCLTGSDMAIRFLLILTLLAPQMALASSLRSTTARVRCYEPACCRVVETTTCCGETVRTMQCVKSGGECRCGIEEHDSSTTPEPIAPPTRVEMTFLPAPLVDGAVHTTTIVRAMPRWTALSVVRDHNTKLAFLGVWRT